MFRKQFAVEPITKCGDVVALYTNGYIPGTVGTLLESEQEIMEARIDSLDYASPNNFFLFRVQSPHVRLELLKRWGLPMPAREQVEEFNSSIAQVRDQKLTEFFE